MQSMLKKSKHLIYCNLIMKATRNYFNRIIAKFINQPMFAVNPSRPTPLQGMFQRFRFAYACKRCTFYVFYELIDFL
jgi:hypothetical protein